MKLTPPLRLDSRHKPAAARFAAPGKGQNASGRNQWLALVMLFQLSTAAVAPAAGRPIVREILVTREGTGARIEIRADQSLAYRSYLMPGLEKWVIDLPGAATTFAGDESKKMRTLPLERITVRQKEVNGDRLTRIGLDFTGDVDFSLQEDQLDKGHLIVIMKPSKTSPQKRAADASPPAAATTLPDRKQAERP